MSCSFHGIDCRDKYEMFTGWLCPCVLMNEAIGFGSICKAKAVPMSNAIRSNNSASNKTMEWPEFQWGKPSKNCFEVHNNNNGNDAHKTDKHTQRKKNTDSGNNRWNGQRNQMQTNNKINSNFKGNYWQSKNP